MTRGAATVVFLLAAVAARAERLPIRVYTTADGLPNTGINCTVRDSKGFLWMCTDEGVSRFDGYSFQNYTFRGGGAGDAGRAAADFLEAGNGDYWVAAAHALCRFNPLPKAGQPLFECYRPAQPAPDSQSVRIAELPGGGIWYLTNRELFRFHLESRTFEQVDLGGTLSWTAMMHDSDGSLWVGAEGALIHRLPDGRVERFGEAEGFPVNAEHYLRIAAVVRDREKRLWVATWLGLCLMTENPKPGQRSVERVYTTRDGLPGNVVSDVFQARDGKLWVSTETGLSEWLPGSGGSPGRFRGYTARKGFNLFGVDGPAVNHLAEDASGKLWMDGPIRLTRHGFTTFTTQDGLKSNRIRAILEDQDGDLIAISADPRPRNFNVFDGERFHTVVPRLPASIHDFTWGEHQIHFQDHTGAWWIAADGGVCRYPKVRHVTDLASTLPERIYRERDGLPGQDILRLFEDSRGDVWITVVGPDVVSRWSRSSDRIEVFRQGENGRPLGAPIAFAEDRAGDVWMSYYWHDLARYRNGRFEVFTPADGLPAGSLPLLFTDHAGRLWIGSHGGGLIRLDDPAAERPRFRVYTVESGLAANGALCITEDRWGRIYTGSGQGIDQLDPQTGRVRHFGESAGILSPGQLATAYRDRHGDLWFGGETLARFVPEPDDASPQPPPIRITRIVTQGGAYPISELGAGSVAGIRLGPAENHLQIEFSSLNFALGETIRFQYRLEGRGQDWSVPADLRSVNYASLSAGSYRFRVRAVNAEGKTSEVPASVAFVILPPFWQRWWFLGLTAVALSLAIAGAHRYRLRQALELERVRIRIATDLHDDVGSSLTQIAILSEVARQNGSAPKAAGAEPLERIADLSRGLVDSMSDIVWAINPERDHLSDLEYRMRRFASDVLAPRDIEFELDVPAGAEDIPLGADVRRQVYLIFKECIHNVVRHSGCARVRMTLESRGHRLVMRVSDDGKGFVPSGDGHGHGLASMRQRAAAAGGELSIYSEPDKGTAVTLQVPVERKSLRP
ncbi:MAG TPA: two-component regulator propeller domain-containing protein [Candidatus Sulfopaludibacter sp.]|nr:two-component regulator propeller domain-containing protein [Candidatus Sulfopaludibacter sp.]